MSLDIIPFGGEIGIVNRPVNGLGLMTLKAFGTTAYCGFSNSNKGISCFGYYIEASVGIGFFVTSNISISLSGCMSITSSCTTGLSL